MRYKLWCFLVALFLYSILMNAQESLKFGVHVKVVVFIICFHINESLGVSYGMFHFGIHFWPLDLANVLSLFFVTIYSMSALGARQSDTWYQGSVWSKLRHYSLFHKNTISSLRKLNVPIWCIVIIQISSLKTSICRDIWLTPVLICNTCSDHGLAYIGVYAYTQISRAECIQCL